MAAKTLTSNRAPVVVDVNGKELTTFISTKVTKNSDGSYSSQIVQSNSKGGNATVIGTRDPNTGEISWNNNASKIVKDNARNFKRQSDNQIDSIQQQLATSAEEKEALNKSRGAANEDLTNGNSDGTSSKAAPIPRNESGEWIGMDVVSSRPRESYTGGTGLCYPLAMRTNLKDNLQINVIKHTPKTMEGLKFKNRPKGPTIGTVMLPMPSAIQDGNKTSWGQGTMTPAQIAMSGGVKKLLGEEGATGAMQTVEDSINQTAGNKNVEESLKNYFTEQLTGTEDLMARTAGMVMNPNMELLFKGPSLRSFSFTWKMSPRDEKESIEIAKIIRMFKQSMAPQKTEEDLFLKAPNLYDLVLNSGKSRNKFLPKMKTCALLDCGVNYTPDGSFMAYDNDSMVAYEMTLAFQEIEPIYNNDMSSGWDSVGY